MRDEVKKEQFNEHLNLFLLTKYKNV